MTPIPQPLADPAILGAIEALKIAKRCAEEQNFKAEFGDPKLAHAASMQLRFISKSLAALEAFAGKEATIEILAKRFEEQAVHAAELNGGKTYYVWEAGVNRSLFDELRGMIDRARKSTIAGKDEQIPHYEGKKYQPGDIVCFRIDEAEARALSGGHSIRCRISQIPKQDEDK